MLVLRPAQVELLNKIAGLWEWESKEWKTIVDKIRSIKDDAIIIQWIKEDFNRVDIGPDQIHKIIVEYSLNQSNISQPVNTIAVYEIKNDVNSGFNAFNKAVKDQGISEEIMDRNKIGKKDRGVQKLRLWLIKLVKNYPGDKRLFIDDNMTFEQYCISKMNTNVSESEASQSMATELEIALLAKQLGMNMVFIRKSEFEDRYLAVKWINNPNEMVTFFIQNGQYHYNIGYIVEGSRWDESSFVKNGVNLIPAVQGTKVIKTIGKEFGKVNHLVELDIVKEQTSDDILVDGTKSSVKFDASKEQLIRAATRGVPEAIANRKMAGETNEEIKDSSYTSKKWLEAADSVYRDLSESVKVSLKDMTDTPVKLAGGGSSTRIYEELPIGKINDILYGMQTFTSKDQEVEEEAGSEENQEKAQDTSFSSAYSSAKSPISYSFVNNSSAQAKKGVAGGGDGDGDGNESSGSDDDPRNNKRNNPGYEGKKRERNQNEDDSIKSAYETVVELMKAQTAIFGQVMKHLVEGQHSGSRTSTPLIISSSFSASKLQLELNLKDKKTSKRNNLFDVSMAVQKIKQYRTAEVNKAHCYIPIASFLGDDVILAVVAHHAGKVVNGEVFPDTIEDFRIAFPYEKDKECEESLIRTFFPENQQQALALFRLIPIWDNIPLRDETLRGYFTTVFEKTVPVYLTFLNNVLVLYETIVKHDVHAKATPVMYSTERGNQGLINVVWSVLRQAQLPILEVIFNNETANMQMVVRTFKEFKGYFILMQTRLGSIRENCRIVNNLAVRVSAMNSDQVAKEKVGNATGRFSTAKLVDGVVPDLDERWYDYDDDDEDDEDEESELQQLLYSGDVPSHRENVGGRQLKNVGIESKHAAAKRAGQPCIAFLVGQCADSPCSRGYSHDHGVLRKFLNDATERLGEEKKLSSKMSQIVSEAIEEAEKIPEMANRDQILSLIKKVASAANPSEAEFRIVPEGVIVDKAGRPWRLEK